MTLEEANRIRAATGDAPLTSLGLPPPPAKAPQKSLSEVLGLSTADKIEPTFKASMGGASSFLPNVAKTFGNIPSSAGRIVEMGVIDPAKNIGKSIEEGQNIYKEQGFVEGTKNIARGVADTIGKAGEFIVGQNEKIGKNTEDRAQQEKLQKLADSLTDRIYEAKKAGNTALKSQLTQQLARVLPSLHELDTSLGGTKEEQTLKGVEDISNAAKYPIERPLDVPLALYGGETAVGKDAISELAGPITRGTDASLTGLGSKIKGSTLGKALTPDSPAIMQRISRTTPSAMNKFERVAGQTQGEYLVDRGIFGTEEGVMKKLYDRFQTSMGAADEALASLDGVYKPKALKPLFDDLIAREGRIGVSSAETAKVHQLADKWANEGLDMSEINEAKRIYERTAKMDYLKQNLPESVARANRIDNEIRGWQFNQARKLGLKNLDDLNKETQMSRQLLNDMGKKNIGSSANNAISLTDYILLSGADPTAIAAYITKKTLGSHTFLSRVAEMFAEKPKVGAPEAIFGGKSGLPAKIPGQDYGTTMEMGGRRPIYPDEPQSPNIGNTPSEPLLQLGPGGKSTGIPTALPQSARETNLGLDEVRGVNLGTSRKPLYPEQLLQKESEISSPSIIDHTADNVKSGKPPKKGVGEIPETNELATALKQAKGLSKEDIIAKHPDINLKRDYSVTDVYGDKQVIPEGEALTPYELKGNKVLLKDGETYIVSKNQFENIKGNSKMNVAKEFAPELKGTEESVLKKEFDEGKIDTRANFKKYLKENDLKLTPTEIEQQYMSDGSYAEAFRDSLRDQHPKDSTKFSSYQLPGGKNYKEIIIKAPQQTGAIYQKWQNYISEMESKYGKDFYNSGKMSGAEKSTLESLHRQAGNGAGEPSLNFQSSHFPDEPNPISHLRLNERTYYPKGRNTVGGKKVTFLEELQSDWAKDRRMAVGRFNERGIPLDEIKHAPDHPLLKNWQELSIKRGLQEAVANKSDYFAWINGEQTSARYNLATHLDDVKWDKNRAGFPNKRIELVPKNKDTKIFLGVDEKGIVERSSHADWNGKKLDEVLGKGLADKIMAEETGTLSGEGLSFGGEWANNLYDKQVKNIVEDLTGGKVEVIDMGLPVDVKKSAFAITATEKTLTSQNMKVGQAIYDAGINSGGMDYIITDILGEGKFKAVPKESWDRFNSKIDSSKMAKQKIQEATQEFDISTPKSSGQMGLKLTPEIRAIIEGKAPPMKKASGESPVR